MIYASCSGVISETDLRVEIEITVNIVYIIVVRLSPRVVVRPVVAVDDQDAGRAGGGGVPAVAAVRLVRAARNLEDPNALLLGSRGSALVATEPSDNGAATVSQPEAVPLSVARPHVHVDRRDPDSAGRPRLARVRRGPGGHEGHRRPVGHVVRGAVRDPARRDAKAHVRRLHPRSLRFGGSGLRRAKSKGKGGRQLSKSKIQSN